MMASRKTNASRGAPFTKTFKRSNIPGRTREGRHAKRVDASFAGFLKRLRRLEFAVLHLCGEMEDFSLDAFVDAVKHLERDAKVESSGRSVRGGKVSLPYEGSSPGEDEGASQNFVGLESGGEDSPFPPSPPPQTEKE